MKSNKLPSLRQGDCIFIDDADQQGSVPIRCEDIQHSPRQLHKDP